MRDFLESKRALINVVFHFNREYISNVHIYMLMSKLIRNFLKKKKMLFPYFPLKRIKSLIIITVFTKLIAF